MAAATVAPIKVSADTNELIAHGSHFLGQTKKDFVEAAVRSYVESNRDAINRGIRESLACFDGSDRAYVSLATGMSNEELDELGGF